MDKFEQYKALFGKYTFRGFIALIIIIGSFGFLYLLMFRAIPENNKDIVLTSSGVILTLSAAVVGWYFGSSKISSDAEKVEQARQLTKTEEVKTETVTSNTP